MAAELAGEDPGSQRALRGGRRLAARLARWAPPEPAPLEVDPDATYLVTGGLGALGLRAAAWLAGLGAGHLLLVGRSGPMRRRPGPSRRSRRPGARVALAAVDVAGPGALAAALAGSGLPTRLGGAVHAAGVVDDAPLAALGWGRLWAALRPKLGGLEAIAGLGPLPWVALYGSAAATLGPAGQGAYAAANAGLEAAGGWGPGWLGVGWGPWSGPGMAERAGSAAWRAWSGSGVGRVDPGRGMGCWAGCWGPGRPGTSWPCRSGGISGMVGRPTWSRS